MVPSRPLITAIGHAPDCDAHIAQQIRAGSFHSVQKLRPYRFFVDWKTRSHGIDHMFRSPGGKRWPAAFLQGTLAQNIVRIRKLLRETQTHESDKGSQRRTVAKVSRKADTPGRCKRARSHSSAGCSMIARMEARTNGVINAQATCSNRGRSIASTIARNIRAFFFRMRNYFPDL